MKALSALAAILISSIVMAAPSAKDRKAADDLERAADDAWAEANARMTPEERTAFEQHVESTVVLELQGFARRCGAHLTFGDQPRFEDKTVMIDASATPRVIECVKKAIPFAQSASDQSK